MRVLHRPGPGLGANYRRLFAASVISNLGDGVGLIAYPWLASAVTRNSFLIALVAVAQRLPWLVFTLPAGVITDRVDRRRLMVSMDFVRAGLTAVVAVAVLMRQGALPEPDAIGDMVRTDTGLYALVVFATLLLGMAEVLRDNSAQTILPALVADDRLEAANGRMWAAEGVANGFAGPPLGSVLLAVAFSLPIFLDAASFFLAATLVMLIPGTFHALDGNPRADDERPTPERRPWRVDLREGFGWLWGHELLRPMAIILGLLNMAGALTMATFVLFAQEVMHIGPTTFAVVMIGGAIGGVVGGTVASRLSRRLGAGTCLGITLAGGAVITAAIGVITWWPAVFVLFGLTSMLALLWNVITVSLRQSIIPSHLLGRVNSVYRFFAWGMMPIGSLLGGTVVFVVDALVGRNAALRATWLVSGAIQCALFVVGRRVLTTAKIEAARASGRSATAVPVDNP